MLAQSELLLRQRTRALQQARAEQDAAQAALARSEALLRTLASNLPDAALLLLDRELRCQQAEGLRLLAELGFGTSQLPGKTLAEFAPAAQLPALETSYRQALAGQRLDRELARGQRVYSLSVLPVRDPAEAVTGVLLLARDVTAQRQAPLALRTERARLELLQSLARASSEPRPLAEACQHCLDVLCELADCPLGQVYLERDGELVSSGCWHDAAPERFARLREQRGRLRHTSGSSGLVGRAAASRRPEWLLLPEAERSQRAESGDAAGLRSALACPVLIGKEVVAVLELFSESSRQPEPRWLELLGSAAQLLGRVVERDRARRALARHSESARRLAIRDELTGLSNRRGFLELAAQHLHLAERNERPAVLFLIDLDGLGQLNDELGREEGDRALLDTADVLRSALRSSDILARLGGDEFVALLPEATLDQAERLRERILSELGERHARGQRRYRVSASIATSCFDPDSREPIEQLLARAARAMHEEKQRRKSGLAPAQCG